MADKIARRGISIYIDGKEVSNSVKGISSEMKKLQNEQAKMTIGSDKYIAAAKKIEYLKSLQREHIANQKEIAKEYGNMEKAAEKASKNSESSFSKLANGFNKYFAIFTAGLAAVTGLTLGLKKFMDMRNELEQSSANLKAITGLDDKSVAWMRQYAKELSTTTTETGIRITATSKEIMDGFTVIGSKRPELLKNKEAMADVTKQALILASTGVPVETAFEVVTASMNQFNLTGKDSNRIINAIAAGSLEGSAEADSLAGSLKNVGTVSNDSNMTLEDTVAMLEVLASKQLVGEESGTKLRGALLKLKEAGVGYASGQFNVRDAIIEVNQQMDKKAGALQRDALLQKIFGAENITAGTILLQNVAAYDKLRVAVTGTDVAMRQAKVQTSTIPKQLLKAQNRFNELGMELVKNLNPAMLKATNFGNMFMKLLMQMPQFLKENQIGIITFTAGLTAYLIAINASNIAAKSKIAWAALDTAADYLKIASMRIRVAVTGEATIAELRLIAAQKAMNSTMMLNIYAAVAIAIAAIAYGVYKLTTNTTEAEKAWKNFNKEAETQVATANQLFEALKKTAEGTQERKLLIDKINSIYGEYLNNQLTEKSNLNEINAAQILVNGSLREKIGIQTREQAKADITKKAIDDQVEAFDSLRKRIVSIKGEDMASVIMENIKFIITNNSGDLIKAHKLASAYLSQQAGKDLKFGDYERLREYTGSLINMNRDLADIDKKFKGFERSKPLQIYTPNDIHNKKPDPVKPTGGGNTPATTPPGKPDKKDPYIDELKLLEEARAKEELINKQAYANESFGEEVFHEWQYNAKLDFLNEKLKLDKKFGKDTTATQTEIAEAIYTENEYWNNKIKSEADKLAAEKKAKEKEELKEQRDHLKAINAIRNEFGLNEIRMSYDDQLVLLKEKLAKEKATEEETARAIADFKIKRAQGVADETSMVASRASEALHAIIDAETMAVDNKYAAQIKAAKKAGKDTTKLEEQAEEEKKAIKKKYAMIDFLITTAKIIAETAAAVMKAAPNVPLQIAEGVLGLAQEGIALQQMQSVQNLWTGTTGFTPNVGKYTPTGVVHGGEFVGAMEGVQNPNIRPVYDLINEAQKQGTVGSITKADLSKALRMSPGYSDGGFVPTSKKTDAIPISVDTNAYIFEVVRAVNRLNDHLDDGISSNINMHGDNGLAKKLTDYEKMINNSKRGS